MANSGSSPPDKMALALAYREENGRCYCPYRDCPLPIDDIEQDRLDIMHKFFTVAREDHGESPGQKRSEKGLHARPLLCNGPPRILDLGCGTGIWCNDMADHYPGANILGWDLSLRMQPDRMPFGVHYQPQDISDPTWDLEPNSMDLIHMRLLGGCVPDWRAVYQNVFNHLKPGTGLFEHIEIDYRPISYNNTLPENSSVNRWMKAVYGAYEQSGRPLFPKEDLHNTLSQLGFTDIMHEDQEIPYHPWPENEHLREISRWFNLAMQSAIPAISLAPLTRYAGWSAKEVTILNADVKREICMRPMEFSCRMHIWHARRP
ncbi:hypothetical protein PG990_012504 [Apiospora arundinis]|uniref:Methyltransferase LaeA n=1 Tax=Apiospora arundinis TaxID=335852 RepID=A0ABR2HQT2_9PEZI